MPVFNGTDGNDFFYFPSAGTTGPDTMFGGGGNDFLDAGPGNDVLDGGSGNDILYGTDGSDRLIGGPGNDVFDIFRNNSVIVTEGPNGGTDVVHTVNTHTLGANFENARLFDGGPGINPNANLTGNGLANHLVGNAGKNRLTGLAGNDTADGGLGNDTSVGGAGNDLHIIGQAGDKILEVASGGGTDTVGSFLINVNVGLFGHVENGTLFGSANLNLTGSNGANKLIGNDGFNRINGLNGNDTITLGVGNDTGDGGLGNDTTIGGTGNDFHIIGQAGDKIVEVASGGGTDTVGSSLISVTLGLFGHVENGTLLGAGNLNLTGTGGANILTGNNGANRINGNGGADQMFGGGGNDTIVYGGAAVKIDGGAGTQDALEVKAGTTLNLATVGDGQVVNTEKVALASNANLLLTAQLVGEIFGDNLVIEGGATNEVSSGLFWFFSEENVEKMVYVLNNITLEVDKDIDTTGLARMQLGSLDGANGFRLIGEATGDGAGSSLALVDTDGDGFLDIITGSPEHDAGFSGTGAVHVFLGDTRGNLDLAHGAGGVDLGSLNGSNGYKIEGASLGDRAGVSVAGGDVNGDGFGDVIIGSQNADPGGSNSGAVFVHLGSGTPANFNLSVLNGEDAFRLDGTAASNLTGASVASGDFNGDGFNDILAGAYQAGPGGPFSGAGYGVFGATGFASSMSFSTLDGTNGFQLPGGAENAGLAQVVGAGDFNNDGMDDIVLSLKVDGSRAIAVISGEHAQSLHDVPINSMTLDGTNGFFIFDAGFSGGVRVATGDVNGDGTADLIVGMSDSDSNGTGNRLAVINGGDDAHWDAVNGIDFTNLSGPNGFFAFDPSFSGGVHVAAGDVNGDGIADIVTGTPGSNSNSGAVRVLFGGAQLAEIQGEADLANVLEGLFGFEIIGRPADRAGTALAVGDIDNDGYGDIVIGGAASGTAPGSVSVVYGDNFNSAVDFVGTANADLLGPATANGQAFVGGLGNDTANGGAFDEVSFRMGADNDLIISNGNFRLIDGGAGMDIWIPTSEVLDFTSGTLGNRLLHVESMDLAETNATVTVNATGWRGLTRTVGVFKIDGDEGDTAVMPADRVFLSFDGTYNYFSLPTMSDSVIGVHTAMALLDLIE